MKIVVVTQNENFYLYEFFDLFLASISDEVEIDCFILDQQNPFGKRVNIFGKLRTTLETFGIRFCLRFFLRLLWRRLTKRTVLDFLRMNNIPFRSGVDINSLQFHQHVKENKIDLIVSVAGAQIFKKSAIEAAPCGIINLHTSNLPKFRGLMPCFWALSSGDKRIGVSIFQVDEGIDSGPLLKTTSINILNRKLEAVIQQTKTVGAVMLAGVVNDFAGKASLNPRAQDHAKATYFSFPRSSDVRTFLRGGNRFW